MTSTEAQVADPVHPEAGQQPFAYGPWTWRTPTDGEHFRRCSWCGSIHPEDLAAEPAWQANWADRKYGCEKRDSIWNMREEVRLMRHLN